MRTSKTRLRNPWGGALLTILLLAGSPSSSLAQSQPLQRLPLRIGLNIPFETGSYIIRKPEQYTIGPILAEGVKEEFRRSFASVTEVSSPPVFPLNSAATDYLVTVSEAQGTFRVVFSHAHLDLTVKFSVYDRNGQLVYSAPVHRKDNVIPLINSWAWRPQPTPEGVLAFCAALTREFLDGFSQDFTAKGIHSDSVASSNGVDSSKLDPAQQLQASGTVNPAPADTAEMDSSGLDVPPPPPWPAPKRALPAIPR